MSDDDVEAWRALTESVDGAEEETPFAELFEAPEATPAKAAKPKTAPRAEEAIQPMVTKASPPKLLVVNRIDGVNRRDADRLKRGMLPIDRTVDMHGLNRVEAYDLLLEAIEHAVHREQRVLCVVTGKGTRSAEGRPVLKEALAEWINEPALRPHLLACVSARPKDGGEGAFYLLLKRQRSV